MVPAVVRRTCHSYGPWWGEADTGEADTSPYIGCFLGVAPPATLDMDGGLSWITNSDLPHTLVSRFSYNELWQLTQNRWSSAGDVDGLIEPCRAGGLSTLDDLLAPTHGVDGKSGIRNTSPSEECTPERTVSALQG